MPPKRQLVTSRKLYLDVAPGYTARMDSTLPYQLQAEAAANRGYERAASNARTPRERTRIRHQQINYNTRQSRQRHQNATGRKPTRSQQRAQQREDRQTRRQQQAIENLTPDVPIIATRQDQLWDKDKVDLAKTQQAFYRDAAANIGVNWGNKLNPYTQQDLIQNAAHSFGISNLVPYTYPAFGGISPAMPANEFMVSSIGGELGARLGGATLPYMWNNPKASLVGEIGGRVLGSGIGGLTTNIANNGGFPIGGGYRLHRSIPTKQNFYYRQGTNLKDAAIRDGKIISIDYANPHFQQGTTVFGTKPRDLETLIYRGKGDYVMHPVDVKGNLADPKSAQLANENLIFVNGVRHPIPKAGQNITNAYTGYHVIPGEVTPTLNGVGNVGQLRDFSVIRPITFRGRRLGYLESPLSRPTNILPLGNQK